MLNDVEWLLNDDGTWTRVSEVEDLRTLLASTESRMAANRQRIAEARALTDRVRLMLRRQREWRERNRQAIRTH